MTKHSVIFDWSKSEASGRDKLYSIIIVGLLFTLVLGMFEMKLPSSQKKSEVQGTLIRFVDKEMARSWALAAEENGPFPGRLETESDYDGWMFEKDGGLASWTDYKVRLRSLREESRMLGLNITPKGKREFPIIPSNGVNKPIDASSAVSLASEPILIPYHAVALEWLPEELPSFDMPVTTDRNSDSLRFLVSLRQDGSVRELIPLAGEADQAQVALENWLRSIRFKSGDGERWFGLRVDFVNRRNNESESE